MNACDAIKELTPKHWTYGTYYRLIGDVDQYCAVGWLAHKIGVNVDGDHFPSRLMNEYGLTDNDIGNIINYNDTPGRSLSEVQEYICEKRYASESLVVSSAALGE